MSAKFDPLTQLVAHRGNAFELPENSLPALRSALELGIRHVEFDIQLSADHVPFVMHDSSLKRCANIDRDALSMNWDELKEVTLTDGARIPALSEVVELLASYPQAIAFVELKRASLRKFGAERVMQRVNAQLKPVARQVVIISFDLAVLTYVQHAIGLPIGWVLSDYSSLTAIKAEATVPNYLFCNQDKLPRDNSRLWRGPWKWVLYEVTTHEQASSLLKRGAHLLETMQVRRLLQELA